MTRHFDDLQLGSLELFCLAADAGSFTEAATLAGVTPAAVSRSVARLEERLGVRLFVRTTRQMRLSEAGKPTTSNAARPWGNWWRPSGR